MLQACGTGQTARPVWGAYMRLCEQCLETRCVVSIVRCDALTVMMLYTTGDIAQLTIMTSLLTPKNATARTARRRRCSNRFMVL